MVTTGNSYSKHLSAKASLGEAQELARVEAFPAIAGARFALVLSLGAFLLSALALAVALVKR